MSLLKALGLNDDVRFAPTTDLVPIIKRAVAKVGAVKDPLVRAEAIKTLKEVDADRLDAMGLSPSVRDKKLGVLSTRLEILIDQISSPAPRTANQGNGALKVRYRVEDRFAGTVYEEQFPDNKPDVFELAGNPRGRFAFRIDGGRPVAPVLQPEPEPEPEPDPEPKPKATTPKPKPPKPKPKPPQDVEPKPEPEPPVAEEAPKVDDEARRKRRAQALKDIEEAKKRWANEDPLIVEYFKKDFADVTLTDGMENVSTVTGWAGTGFKLVPGGQGAALAMELVGLTADVANTTYVVTKALLLDPAAQGGGRLAQKGTEKISALVLKKTKKTIVKKLKAKYPMAPDPLLEKLVDEAVDRLVGKVAEGLGDGVRETIEEHVAKGEQGKPLL